ncbi:MAG: hypothetical protein Q8O14_11780 [bacterium]|nr:hypothetical protein [bacterium]
MALGQREGLDLRVSAQPWGARLEGEPTATFAGLGPEVWIVEMPGPTIEERLRRQGHTVRIIDHHWYWQQDGSVLDRRHALSSLEQVAQLLHVSLSPWEKAIALNDRGYIWAMLDGEVPYDLAMELRRQERNGHAGLDSPPEWQRLACVAGGEIWWGSGSHAALLDRLSHMDEQEWRAWLGRGRQRAAREPLRMLLDDTLKNGSASTLTGYGE